MMKISVPIFPTETKSIEFAERTMTAREIVQKFIAAEISRYHQAHSRSELIGWLSENEILSRAETGAVSMENRQDAENEIDGDESLQAVIQAISDGLVLIFIDEKPVADLDADLSLTAESKIAFVRLHTLRG